MSLDLSLEFSDAGIRSASLEPVVVGEILTDGFELTDGQIIPSSNISSSFIPSDNKVELFFYDYNKNLLQGFYNFNDWTITENNDTQNFGATDIIQLDPILDSFSRGYSTGKLYSIYNFVNYELNSDPTLGDEGLFYISEISSDRTEIRIKSNYLTNEEIEEGFNNLNNKITSADYFDEFYIVSFEPNGNSYNIAVNLELDTQTSQSSVIFKLYDALPAQFEIKSKVYVATKVAESKAYLLEYFAELFDPAKGNYIQGPNYNLDINDFVNNSTELKNKNELLNSNSTSSKNTLDNKLNKFGVKITPNYSYDTFSEFVNFSSAKSRINNFYEKVSQIQGYEDDISALNTITGSTSASVQSSASKAILEGKINGLIKNFDGYEYYLYYESSSFAYPKTGSSYPYSLLSTGSTEVLTWLGSDIESNFYYGGILLSASFYDNDNQNWLYYTIPEFIRSDEENNNYIEFSNMVGQHFDEIWLYIKSISERHNTTNQLDKGLPLDLAQTAVKNLGFEGFSNNWNDQNNFIGLIGEDDGVYVPPTGSETITNYIAINNGNIVNYWNPSYSFLFYVQQLGEAGYPYAIDKVTKEIYKRLYHNMAYLVKKKGTISGLRQLINIWGIPNTILRINEFGGKNKDNTDDYDFWYNRYNYAFTAVSNQHYPSASVVVPWRNTLRNRLNGDIAVPDSIQFRFKTTGYPSSSYAGTFFSQSLLVKKSDSDLTSTNFDFGIALYYTGSLSGSYSGSATNERNNWGLMKFYLSGSAAQGGTFVSDPIYLPFFNGDWWSVMLQRSNHYNIYDSGSDQTYTLYAKNKIYNGFDGNSIGFEGTSSVSIDLNSSSLNESWNKIGIDTSSFQEGNGIYLGGFISGANVGNVTIQPSGKLFSGSFQELRYYDNPLPETIFNDFVMNPESIEGITVSGSLSSFDILSFRAPLGNELEDDFTVSISASHTESFISSHPATTASAASLITQSFADSGSITRNSNYYVQYYENDTIRTYSKTNREVYFLDQPSVGIRNRVSNKIQIDDAEVYGNVLSTQTSIQQNYQISRSYTEDITNLEVAFSPQDEKNDDIIQAFGYGVISDALADPRLTSESIDYYPKLRETADYFFQKYTKGNVYDYIRLIKYVDSSLFKAIKAYIPARTSVSTGIVIKQHMLERNRFSPPSITKDTPIAITPETGSVDQGTPQEGFNSPIFLENLLVSASISVNDVKGGTGGVLDEFNYSGSASFDQSIITQSWNNTFDTVVGTQTITQSFQDEFYDGEFSGSNTIATTQSLTHNNVFLEVAGELLNYDLYFYSSSYNSSTIWLDGKSGLGNTQNVKAVPNSGQIDVFSGEDPNISTVKFGSGGTDSNINVAPLAP